MNTEGKVFKYPDNVDTDVIIPARYLNTPDANELALHCMEDILSQFFEKRNPFSKPPINLPPSLQAISQGFL